MYKSLKSIAVYLALTAIAATRTWDDVPKEKDWLEADTISDNFDKADSDFWKLAFAVPVAAIATPLVGVVRAVYSTVYLVYASANIWLFAAKRGFKRVKGFFGR